ncbi:acyltransferase [Vibrio sp. SCSIO 43135]|uniref:acyltransferase family protein n=1 Tax=Vibrio sp. SCSIO 43135 TaxID=2819096 RepID=UPI002074E37A|nr:acyltransferase family protein [Vibrio sp. SCSIO 43135]USD41376.1 acyltransferase [Vibrio sp. SCSIO 43135]
MQFRQDINGLRAIAVIAVVLFHFNPDWMPGGFAGVDVFFVISGFLMTGIIFRGLEKDNFSLSKFYIARANRIIPALATLCLVLLLFGWFYLTPLDYKALGKHTGSSIGFFSNITYWKESGYFDTASHEKWLLHTWSLSAEWQFYIIYPLILVAMKRFMSLKAIKSSILVGAVIGYAFCVFSTHTWPDASYYLLSTRAWEMMIGGVAYLYPLNTSENGKKALEWSGLSLIISSFMFISKDDLWPGHLSIIPVLGVFLLIQAKRNDSLLTGNIIFRHLGKWSYSIYLWHWPFVVAIYYFSLSEHFIYLGISLSVLLGFLSSKYIERAKLKHDFVRVIEYFNCKPILLVFSVALLSVIISSNDGFIQRTPHEYQDLVSNSTPSPLRKKCHIGEYRSPSKSCEYFEENVSWATFGDSHTVEIAYALAEKLRPRKVGLKHFSFSGCRPSYKEPDDFSKCSKWYNETIEYIMNNDRLQNIVFNHRFTTSIFGGDATHYPKDIMNDVSIDSSIIINKLDELILLLASKKDNVYIFYPIPELPRSITQLVGDKLRNGGDLNDVIGTNLNWYKNRNKHIINHFNNAKFPENVHFIKPEDAFCDKENCYAVKDGVPLYFDDNHPSVLGASKLVELINTSN